MKEEKEKLSIIKAEPNLYALWGGLKDKDSKDKDDYYWITRVFAFQCSSYWAMEEWTTQLTPIAGDFNEGFIDNECSSQIIFIGSQNECENEKIKLIRMAKIKKKSTPPSSA